MIKREEKNIFSKKGQVTIFVIVGILIVMAILLLFFLQNRKEDIIKKSDSPVDYIKTNVRETINPLLEEIISSGGLSKSFSKDNELKTLKDGRVVSVLCTTSLPNISCKPTHPLLLEEIKMYLEKELYHKIDDSFDKFAKNSPSEVTLGELDLEVDFDDEQILLMIRKPVSIDYEEGAGFFKNYDTSEISRMYIFTKLAGVIIDIESSCKCDGSDIIIDPSCYRCGFHYYSQPSSNCEPDLLKLNRDYPNFVFYRENIGNGEKVYTISPLSPPHQNFSFYVKSCVKSCGCSWEEGGNII